MIPCDLLSQLDTIHYIPPLHSRKNNQVGNHYLYISTPSSSPFSLTIEDGAGNVLATANISDAVPYIYNLGNTQNSSSKHLSQAIC